MGYPAEGSAEERGFLSICVTLLARGYIIFTFHAFTRVSTTVFQEGAYYRRVRLSRQINSQVSFMKS